LTNHRITRDNSDLNKIMMGIQSTMNPFDEENWDENLYCLSTGKAASDSVKKELLHCTEIREKQCQKFRDECFATPARFEKPITRCKVKNFAADAVKMKVTVKDNKIKELQGTRDLFGRLLYLAAVQDLDLPLVFTYPLTPVPLSLAHVNGTLHKTDKSNLMHKLEEKVTSGNPPTKDAYVVDAMFFLRSQVQAPSTFGGLAKTILSKLLGLADRVDFVCDTYKSPSIKDVERNLRGPHDGGIDFKITGSDQKCPKDIKEAMKSSKFKTALLRLLAEEWEKQAYLEVIRGHALYVGLEDKAYLYEVHDNSVCRKEVDELACSHEEADSRLAWHVKHICYSIPNGNIIVRANDTGVLIILLTHDHALPAHIWYDCGLNSNNTRRYVDISLLASDMGPELCAAIAGFHAFTGSDYTASFLNKGKVRPLALMEKSAAFIAAFGKLGESSSVPPETVADLEAYVCSMYAKPRLKSVNNARQVLFNQHFAPKNESQPLEKIKGTHPSSLPPCSSVLLEKIKRTNLVTSVWKNALSPDPMLYDPIGNGWFLENGYCAIKWYEGRPVPTDLCNHIDQCTDMSGDDEEDDDLYYSSDDEYDSDSD